LRNRSRLLTVVATLTVTFLVVFLIPTLVTASGPAAHPSIRPAQSGPPTLVLSHGGKTLAVYHFACGPNLPCNMVEFDWRAGKCTSAVKPQSPPVVAIFTSAGQYDAPPALAPCLSTTSTTPASGMPRRQAVTGANDIEYATTTSATSGTESISSAWWTLNGKRLQRILPPQLSATRLGANTLPPDAVHVYWSYGPKERLTRVELRKGKQVVGRLKVPAGANEADWYGFTPQATP
jgi:hypothetical protein